jgi:hypothetical protein
MLNYLKKTLSGIFVSKSKSVYMYNKEYFTN